MKKVIVILLLIASSFLYGEETFERRNEVIPQKEGGNFYYPEGKTPSGLSHRVVEKLLGETKEYAYSGGENDSLKPIYVKKDYTPVLYALLVFMIILLLFLRHFNLMKREIHRRKRVEKDLRERMKIERELRGDMELISQIGKELTSNLDVWAALRTIDVHMEKIFGEHIFGVIAKDEETDRIYYKSYLGGDGRRQGAVPPEATEVFESDQVMFSNHPKIFSRGSCIFIPLKLEERFIGVMYFEVKKMMNPHEREFLVQLANFISIAVSNSDEAKSLEEYAARQEELQGEKQVALDRLNLLGVIGSKIGATFDIYSIGGIVFSYYKQSGREAPFGIAVKDTETGEMRYEYLYTGKRELRGRNGDLLKSKTVREAVSAGEARVIRGKDEHLNRQEDLKEVKISASETASSLYYPIKFSGEVLGLMVVEKEEENFIDNIAVEGAKSLVGMLGIALNNSLKAKELEKAKIKFEKLSLTDELTKLPNRRAFYEKFLTEWSKSVEGRRNLGIIIIDLDYFKQVNDKFGHLEGDRVLKEISGTLKLYERPGDKNGLFGRYGGDEFIGGFSGHTSQELMKKAEEIRGKARGIKYQEEVGGRDYLSLSIGVYVGDPCRFRALRDFIKEADRAMYSAKKRGRNQTFLLEGSLDL